MARLEPKKLSGVDSWPIQRAYERQQPRHSSGTKSLRNTTVEESERKVSIRISTVQELERASPAARRCSWPAGVGARPPSSSCCAGKTRRSESPAARVLGRHAGPARKAATGQSTSRNLVGSHRYKILDSCCSRYLFLTRISLHLCTRDGEQWIKRRRLQKMESEETAQVAGLQHPKDFQGQLSTHHSSRSDVGPNELRSPRCARAARKRTAAEI
jgi:hypothetical protein